MKNLKKLLTLALATALTMSLVACGEKAESTDSSEKSDAADSSADATDATDAADGETFKIGGIGPTTGGAAVYGLAVQYGAEIAMEEINAAGGINGTPIEFNFQDDEHNAEKSVNAYNALKDWDMELLLGTVTSDPAVAVAPEAANDGMFMLTPSGSSTKITEGRTNVFQVCFSDPNQGTGAAQYIGENGLATKVAVIYNSSDVYSSGNYETFAAEAANQNFEIVSTEAFTADTMTDFSVQLQKSKDSGAELIFIPIYAQEASLLLTQAASVGVEAKFFGCDGLDGVLSIEGFDPALAEGVILLTPFVADATDDATVSFVTKYEEAHGEVPNQFAADAYDGMYIIKAAIEASGATPDMSAADMGAAVIGAMTEISYDGLTGEGMTWAANGEVAKDPKAMVIENGVYVSLK